MRGWTEQNLKFDVLSPYIIKITHIGDQLLNDLCYPADLCLISMLSVGMQRLLNMCTDYAEQDSLLYNGSKTFSMCFSSFTSKEIKFERSALFLDSIGQ